jgi:hypothetical protein
MEDEKCLKKHLKYAPIAKKSVITMWYKRGGKAVWSQLVREVLILETKWTPVVTL